VLIVNKKTPHADRQTERQTDRQTAYKHALTKFQKAK